MLGSTAYGAFSGLSGACLGSARSDSQDAFQGGPHTFEKESPCLGLVLAGSNSGRGSVNLA